MPSHAQAPAPSAASAASSSASSSPKSTMSDVPPDATQPMSRRQNSTRSVETTATEDTVWSSATAPPAPYSEEEMERLTRMAKQQVRTSTYGPEFLRELEKTGLTGTTGDGIGKVTVVTEEKEASAIYHSIINNTHLKAGQSAPNILFAVPSRARDAKGKVVDLLYANLPAKKDKKPLHRLKGEKRRKGFLDAEFSKAPSADFMDKVNARLEQAFGSQGTPVAAAALPELQPSPPRLSPEEKELPPVPPQDTAGPSNEDLAPLEPPRPPFLSKPALSTDSVLSLASLTPRTPLKLVNPDPFSADSSRRASVVPPAAFHDPSESAKEDVLIVYLNQEESPRGRRKHKSKSSSPTGDKSKGKREAEDAAKRPPKSVRKTSDGKVKRVKSAATSDMKRSKSIAATERTAHTHVSVVVTDTDAGAGAELDRHGTHKSSKREKNTWHGNTAGKAPTGLDRKPVLDQLHPMTPTTPTRTPSYSSHRSNSMRASVHRTHSIEEEDEEVLPLQVLMQALGYTPPPPPPPIQQSPFTPYTTVQSPGAYSHAPIPFTPYTTHGTPAHYPAMTPFSTPFGGQVPQMMTPFGNAAPSMAPASPWSGTSAININVASPFVSPYHQQQAGYTPHSMMSSASLPHGSTAASTGIYAGVGNTPVMNGYVYSPFGASTPMLLPQNNNSAGGGGPHLYASPYATNPQVLYSS